jgi:hypothetical protein
MKENQMTTTVTVEAHCAGTTEVQIIISHDGTAANESIIIQNGEKWVGHVHDLKSVHVQEIPKS